METQGRKLDFSGQHIFVGIDVHRKSWRVSVLVGDVLQKTIHMSPPGPETLLSFLNRSYPHGEYTCVYEAGFCGFWAQRHLTMKGIKTVIVHAADVPTTDKERQQKDDVRDSRKLARALRNGELESIYVPGEEQQRVRALVRRRWTIAADRRRVMNRIKMHLHYFGTYPPGGALADWSWTKTFISWLEEQAKTDKVLTSLLKQYHQERQLEQEVTREIRKLLMSEPHVESIKLLCSIPGIGFLSAALFLSEIVDMHRFNNLDQLCFYVGLAPQTNSSGEKEVARQRTTRGNKKLRTALIECAWRAIRQDPEMTMCYATYKKRMDGPHAIIKIARKLLNRIRCVWTSGKPYERLDAPQKQNN